MVHAFLKFHKKIDVHPHITARAHIDNKGVILNLPSSRLGPSTHCPEGSSHPSGLTPGSPC